MMTETTETTVLQDKVLRRAAHNQPQIAEVIKQIKSEDKFLTDDLVWTNEMGFEPTESGIIMAYGDRTREMGDFATKQLANRYGVPTPYIKKLNSTEWGRTLAADILNRHSKKADPQRLLIRGVEDQVRGVLSDSYKRINSLMIFEAFLLAALSQDAKIYNAAIDDTKSFIEIIIPEIITMDTPTNGIINLIFGSELRNSDFGDGRLNLRFFALNTACLNGMIGHKYLNEVHRGSKMPENLVLSQETYRKESIAQAGVITDSMAHLFNKDNMQREIDRIERATQEPLDPKKGIERLKKSKHYSETELDLLALKLSAENPEDGIQGENTRWKFAQGITAVANQYNTTRRNELIELGSEFLN